MKWMGLIFLVFEMFKIFLMLIFFVIVYNSVIQLFQ